MALNETQISALESKGFKRWQKNGMDRLYINATRLGLELTFYNTGNVRSAAFNGEWISNSRGRGLRDCKTYIDVADGSVHSGDSGLKENAQKLLDEVVQAA